MVGIHHTYIFFSTKKSFDIFIQSSSRSSYDDSMKAVRKLFFFALLSFVSHIWYMYIYIDILVRVQITKREGRLNPRKIEMSTKGKELTLQA